MPLAVIPGSQGYRNLKSKASWWPGRVDGEDNRVEPIAKPEYMPTFQLIPGEPVFTVGSCFARFIEVYLGRNGYQVPMASYKPKEEGDSLGLMNKFSPYSVLNEFQWALDPDFANFDQRRALCSEGGELWMDTQLVSKLALSEERAMARRFEVNGLFKLVKDCRIVILTLGLVEAWYDTKNRIYLNTSVSHYMQKYDPDRFELHVLSFKELYDCTRRTIELILKYGHPEARVLLTVSPVALTALPEVNGGITVPPRKVYSTPPLICQPEMSR